LGDLINGWRKRTLELESVEAMVGANLTQILNVPFTYCWSPSLIPKPFDWAAHIGIDLVTNTWNYANNDQMSAGFSFENHPRILRLSTLLHFLMQAMPQSTLVLVAL